MEQRPRRLDAREVLGRLLGQEIPTMTGRPNRAMSVGTTEVIVATTKSPHGQPVPIQWVQEALDRLTEEHEVEISVASVGYRSAFIGAVLLTIPGTRKGVNPSRVILGGEPIDTGPDPAEPPGAGRRPPPARR